MSTNLELKAGKYYRRRDGRVVGPLVPSQKCRNRGVLWVTQKPTSGYYADGRCSHANQESHDLIEEIEDISTVDPREFPATHTRGPYRKKEAKAPASIPPSASTHRLVVDGVTVKAVINGDRVQILGVDQPFPVKSLEAVIELLMEVM